MLEADAAFLGQMAKQVLQEASVNPGRSVRISSHQRPLLICEGFDIEPSSQPLEFGQAVIGVETSEFVQVRRFREEFSPKLFHQIIDQERDVEAARKVVKFEIEAVLGRLRRNSVSDPFQEASECDGSQSCTVEFALCRMARRAVAAVPEVPAKPGCHSTVQTKRLHARRAANGDFELYAIESVARSCQTLVFRLFQT